MSETNGTSREVREIPVEQIEISEFCRREEQDEDLAILAANIERRGMLQYPVVMQDAQGYKLIAGSRRFLAARQLQWTTLPCRIVRATPEQGIMVSLSENAFRRSRHPVEEAKNLRALVDSGLTETQIAEEMGMPQSVVAERLSLLLLDEDILKRIDTRPRSSFQYSHAVQLSKLMRAGRPNREMEVRELLQKTVRGRLPASELRALVSLVTEGQYDRLPAELRALFLSNPFMNSKLTRLFLRPHEAVQGDGQLAADMRSAAGLLSQAQLVQFVLRAVKNRWTPSDAEKRFLDLLGRQRRAREVQDDVSVNAQSLKGRFQQLWEELKAEEETACASATTDPDIVLQLRASGSELLRSLQAFLSRLERLRQTDDPGSAGKTKETNS